MLNAGVGMPHNAPLLTTSLQPGCALRMALLKKSSNNKFSRSGFLRYAAVMSLRNTDRMMHPPRHIKAMDGLLSFHLYSLAACHAELEFTGFHASKNDSHSVSA